MKLETDVGVRSPVRPFCPLLARLEETTYYLGEQELRVAELQRPPKPANEPVTHPLRVCPSLTAPDGG